MDEIRVAVIGAGANTRARHIPGLRAQEKVKLIGVCNRSRSSSERAAAELGFERAYAHWMEAVDDPDVNAIVIGTWPYLHARVTMAALDAGKHVLTEARMARDAAEAHAMLAVAQEHPELTAQVVPSPMSLGVDATIQRVLAEGRLGEILFIEHRPGSTFFDAAAPMHWRQDSELSGLNVQALGIVYEMIMRWVGEAVRVTARERVFAPTRPGADGLRASVQVPDHIDVLAEMACGASLHLQQTAVAALRTETGTWVYGTEGALRFDGRQLWFGGRDAKGLAPVDIPDSERGGWRVEEEFVRAIRGLEPVTRTTFEDGVRYMEFIEAARRSAARGRTIALPLQMA